MYKYLCAFCFILAVDPTIYLIRLGVTETTAIDEFAKHYEDRSSPKLYPKIYFELNRERIFCPL